jgi:hypothetical protein
MGEISLVIMQEVRLCQTGDIMGCLTMSESPIFNSFRRYSYYSEFGTKMSPDQIELLKMIHAIPVSNRMTRFL